MNLIITTYATARYTYALADQAPLMLAALHYAGIEVATWVYASDDSLEAAAAFAAVKEALADAVECVRVVVCGTVDNPTGKHEAESNLSIAKLQAAAWHEARRRRADLVWSLESDILPNANTLRSLMDTLAFDRGWYDVAMAGYPNRGYLGGYGSPSHWISPSVYPDERELTDDLKQRLEARDKRLRQGGAPLSQEEKDQFAALDKEVEQCAPLGNAFALQAKAWRPRGWLETAYPGVGQGAMLPTQWVGLGCTLLSGRALDLAHWVGYEGNGTQDLWLCWRCWHPAGIRMAVVPHALCSHRKRQEDGSFVTWFARHELGGPQHGHLRCQDIVHPPPAMTARTFC